MAQRHKLEHFFLGQLTLENVSGAPLPFGPIMLPQDVPITVLATLPNRPINARLGVHFGPEPNEPVLAQRAGPLHVRGLEHELEASQAPPPSALAAAGVWWPSPACR